MKSDVGGYEELGAKGDDVEGRAEAARSHLMVPRWQSDERGVWDWIREGVVIMLPPTALCWEAQVSGRLVDGMWCRWIMMASWPPYGIHGTMEVKNEVQRAIQRAELTAFVCLLKRMCGPTGIIGGLWQGEMR